MNIDSISPAQLPLRPKAAVLEVAPQQEYSRESMSYKKMDVEYSNKDGDSVSLSLTSLELERVRSEKSEKDGKTGGLGISAQDLKLRVQAELLDMLKNGNDSKPAFVDPYGLMYAIEEETEAAEVPEFWNAENTSQRIVDFAMSFKDVAGMEDNDYFQMMKDAVAEGFKQAKEIMGNLPGPVAQLFNDTYQLTMEKLDALSSSGKESPAAEEVLPREIPVRAAA